jgi:hypothetical protein
MGIHKIFSMYEVFDRVKLYNDSSVYVIVACRIKHVESKCLKDKVCSTTNVVYDVRRITANDVGNVESVTCDKIEGYCE